MMTIFITKIETLKKKFQKQGPSQSLLSLDFCLQYPTTKYCANFYQNLTKTSFKNTDCVFFLAQGAPKPFDSNNQIKKSQINTTQAWFRVLTSYCYQTLKVKKS